MTPLLSICIPTYNHAELLDRALARLTSLPAFASGDVEVVLSDNASTDGTLVDDIGYHIQAWHAFSRAHGHESTGADCVVDTFRGWRSPWA